MAMTSTSERSLTLPTLLTRERDIVPTECTRLGFLSNTYYEDYISVLTVWDVIELVEADGYPED